MNCASNVGCLCLAMIPQQNRKVVIVLVNSSVAWARLGGGQWDVGGGQCGSSAVGRGQWAVGRRQWDVGQWDVGQCAGGPVGPWAVGGGRSDTHTVVKL